jgi:hypothetical protein
MTMPVTDEQEATLHAQLAGNFDEHMRLLNGLDPAAARTGYRALVSAAFFLAAEGRFSEGTPAAEIIDYVADVRSRTNRTAAIDPVAAERVLRAVSADEEIGDIDGRTKFRIQLLLLGALIADAQLGAQELDEFMLRARRLADRWLS